MVYISTRFGFIAKLTEGTNHRGEPVLKAQHCIDVREALPFKNRGEAEKMYRRTSMAGFWHCILSTLDSDIRPCPAEAGRGSDMGEE